MLFFWCVVVVLHSSSAYSWSLELKIKILFVIRPQFSVLEPGWHNWLARETFMSVNLKVEGSSPSSGEKHLFYITFCFALVIYMRHGTWLIVCVETGIGKVPFGQPPGAQRRMTGFSGDVTSMAKAKEKEVLEWIYTRMHEWINLFSTAFEDADNCSSQLQAEGA